MIKKDFELIARVMSQFTGEGKSMVSPDLIAGELASALAGTNERFNRELFLAACGMNNKNYKCTDCGLIFLLSDGRISEESPSHSSFICAVCE